MKVTSKLEVKPRFEGVTLELDPREAYLMLAFISRFSQSQCQDHINKARLAGITNGYPVSLIGEATTKEADLFYQVYDKLDDALKDAKKAGVK